ncbi:MAG: hypothetical protein DRN27_01340 [Thermoplasmata archaeon]|nr:MAG: hypothetical protein DRN27_01340 [Thermoplasmata archaeon]
MKYNIKIEFFIIIITMLIALMVIIFLLLPPDPSTVDSDNDGVMNDKDVFPNDQYESNDTDNDGVGDNSDKFIFDPSASIDSDDDGYPDKWNDGKSQNDSTSDPKLIIDEFPYDPNEHVDSDGDGVGDNSDAFPNDSTESFDFDKDGIGNNKDKNPNVDLGFKLYIDKFELTKNVDILPRGQIYFEIKINDELYTVLDNDGDYWKVWLLQEQSIGFTLTKDILDDTDRKNTSIEIIMYDMDYFFNDDIVDIHSNNIKTNLMIVIDHVTNKVNINNNSKGQKATVWFTVTLPEYIEPNESYQQINYDWSYKGKWHTISLNISTDKYNWYTQRDVNRSPQHIGKNKMVSFVTENDEVIQDLTLKILEIANQNNYNNSETINLILSFIQKNIDYKEDILSKNTEEYWKFPIETLVEKNGDCEDSSILFQSIIKNTDYDVIMLFYIIDDETGHLASGVCIDENINGDVIEYKNKNYYYCETTSNGFVFGVKPEKIPDEPEMIIDIP